MTERPHRRWTRSIAAPLIALAACATDRGQEPPIDLATVEQLRESDVSKLTLTQTGSITLGTAAETVGEVSDFRISRGNYYVLDAPSRRIRVFDSRGRLLNTIGREGSGPGEFQNPLSITFLGENLLVADLSTGNVLSRFSHQGGFVDRKGFAVPGHPSSLAADGDLIASMGLLDIADPAAEGWDVVGIANARGDSIGAGCVIDPRYVASRKVNGTLSHMGFGTVTARDGEIYCTQGISPVVQVMDRTGRPLRQIRVAPPFYVAPQERAAELNQKAFLRYFATFTANGGYFPVEGGFVQMYTRFDENEGEIRHHLLVCRSGTPPRCGTVQNIRRPVHIPSLDTLYINEEIQPDEPVRTGIYHLTGLRN